MASNARLKRLQSDYEHVMKDFTGHKFIFVQPEGMEPPEKYHITYFVNGIYLDENGMVQLLQRHEVEITLHSDYPRYKPICKILTPIWHPNFKDGQICIGDIWGAGESLSDIIVNIGDMIQYKSWNSMSPLNADAAKWAIENKAMFPVGDAELHTAEFTEAVKSVKIDVEDEVKTTGVSERAEGTVVAFSSDNFTAFNPGFTKVEDTPASDGNDFEITAEELAGIEFVPTAVRMQSGTPQTVTSGKKINFKTIFTKGLVWALIGALLGFIFSEVLSDSFGSDAAVAKSNGYPLLAQFYKYNDLATEELSHVEKEYKDYCKKNGLAETSDSFSRWYQNNASASAKAHAEKYLQYEDTAEQALYQSYLSEFNSSETRLSDAMKKVTRGGTARWTAIVALFIGMLLGVGEGVYYGSKEQAIRSGAIGAGISLVIGYFSGLLAQLLYAKLLKDSSGIFSMSLVRGVGWAIMGLGIGGAIGLIKPGLKRIVFCCIGGAIGAFIGGFLFNYIGKVIPDDKVSRAIGIIIMGGLIGLGVGLLEQAAKSAWLKVVRGEFEGKEYLVFNGVTSIGNTGKNTIVLFKDKLVAPHHCDITLDRNQYILTDAGTPLGTVVNGNRISRHVLRQGDTIAIGNSVLVFNTK